MTSPLKNLVRPALLTAGMLLIPFVAMHFTREVTWTLADFVVAGSLLFGSGLTYELVAHQGSSIAYRGAVGVAVAAGLLLIWLNLAVGLIGNEHNPASLLYSGVLLAGFGGALLVRFRPLGMARVLLLTALTQALVPLLAPLIWQPQATTAAEGLGSMGALAANAVFVVLWLSSAWLFRRAGTSASA